MQPLYISSGKERYHSISRLISCKIGLDKVFLSQFQFTKWKSFVWKHEIFLLLIFSLVILRSEEIEKNIVKDLFPKISSF